MTQAVIEEGNAASNIITEASPIVSQLFATIWNHMPGGIAQMIIPATVIHDAVQGVCAKMSAAVRGQTITLSIPSGWIGDVVTDLEARYPGFIHAVHTADPDTAPALAAVGALPAAA